MKKQLICLLLILGTSLSSFKKDGPKRIIFFGDSITQAGVNKTGYITKMTEMIAAQGLSNQYELIGENRNTVKSLRYFGLEEIDNEVLRGVITEAKTLYK